MTYFAIRALFVRMLLRKQDPVRLEIVILQNQDQTHIGILACILLVLLAENTDVVVTSSLLIQANRCIFPLRNLNIVGFYSFFIVSCAPKMVFDKPLKSRRKRMAFLVLEIVLLAVSGELVVNVFLLLGLETGQDLRGQGTLVDVLVAVKRIEMRLQRRREVLI